MASAATGRRAWRYGDPTLVPRPAKELDVSLTTSPFPPIADYAFLSDCHTGALVAPGRVGRLAVPARLRLAQRVRQPARPRRRVVPVRAVRDQRADRPHLRAGHQRADDHVAHPRRVAAGARRADDGAAAGRGHRHAAHPAAGRRRRRPHAGPHGRVPRGHGRGRARLRAGVRLRPGPGHLDPGRRRHAADASRGRPDASGSAPTCSIGIEGRSARARHVLSQG